MLNRFAQSPRWQPRKIKIKFEHVGFLKGELSIYTTFAPPPLKSPDGPFNNLGNSSFNGCGPIHLAETH
jgi:hypothetical protein